MGEVATEEMTSPIIPNLNQNKSFVRRNRPGSKRSDWANWPDQTFSEMESIHAAQMLIQQRIRNCRLSIDKILEKPEGADEDVWKYEHLRQFCQELNGLATRLQVECSPSSCPQMTATDQWIFLCAAHKSPKECSAIDYTRHTLDGAANLLNNSKYFPSRVSLKLASVTKLGSISRRIYRIFSHAYYHHKPIFLDFENLNQLCRRFTKFVTMYDLMPKDNLIVPVDSLESGLSNESFQNNETNKDASITGEASVDGSVGGSVPVAFYPSGTIARTETNKQEQATSTNQQSAVQSTSQPNQNSAITQAASTQAAPTQQAPPPNLDQNNTENNKEPIETKQEWNGDETALGNVTVVANETITTADDSSSAMTQQMTQPLIQPKK